MLLTWHLHVCVVAGVKVEGILRESADVALVEKRVADYEQGEERCRHRVPSCVSLPTASSSTSICGVLIPSSRVSLGRQGGSSSGKTRTHTWWATASR